MENLDRRSFLKASAIGLADLQLGLKSPFHKDSGCSMVIGKDLPPRYPRRIVPEHIDLGNWFELEPIFARLMRADLHSPAAVEEWMLDISALAAAITEEGARRNIAMTCHTDSPGCEKRYMQFVNRIQPLATLCEFVLLKKYAAAPGRPGLPESRYFVLNRTADNMVALFRVKNIPLQQQEEKLCVSYEKLTGAMTVNFQGQEYTLAQMAKFLDQNDRGIRKEAWESSWKRVIQDRGALEDTFNGLMKLRIREARNAGFDNYRDYAFRSKERFDYGVRECEEFHSAVEKVAVPLYRGLLERRRQKLGLDKLRPWDLAVDVEGRAPLRPFETVDQLVAGCVKILDRIHPDFAKTLAFLNEHALLDLESRKGKSPGGYQSVLEEYRLPFIFMNAAGVQGDVSTLLHESGHAVHTMECREEPLIFYRSTGMEFSELASQSMEAVGRDHYEVFYSAEDAKRARIKELEDDISFFCWCARIDAFQHWLYTHPGHTVAEREQEWMALHERFGPTNVDFSGYDEVMRTSWHRQSHIFLAPFYYIEYGISLLGALQVWDAVRRDQKSGIATLRRGLKLGGSRPMPELYAAAGLKFDFSEKTLRPLLEEVAREIEI